jgi:hypothetical protein
MRDCCKMDRCRSASGGYAAIGLQKEASMNTSSLFRVIGLPMVLVSSLVFAADGTLLGSKKIIRIATTDRPRWWTLVLCDGNLGFYGLASIPPGPNAPLIPVDNSRPRIVVRFTRDGATLQIYIAEDERALSQVQVQEHEWFLTGDYATTPPSVILTKEPTKYSRWTFVNKSETRSSEGGRAYIKNENDLGKEAWLSVDGKGIVFRQGWEIRQPILSFDCKTEFDVTDQVSQRAPVQETRKPIAFRYTVNLGGMRYKSPGTATSPDGTTMLRVEDGSGRKQSVRLYDAKTEKAVGPEIEVGRVSAIAVGPDNITIATAITNAGWDWGQVQVWNGRTGSELRIDPNDIGGWGARPVSSMKFSEDGKTLSVIAGGPSSK